MREHAEIENERAHDLAKSVSLGMRLPARSLKEAFSAGGAATAGGKTRSGYEYWEARRKGRG